MRRRTTLAIGLTLVLATAAGASPESTWQELAAGNRRFACGKPRPRDLVPAREALVEAQHPRAIVLGCSDSRVSPEILFDQGLGDLFVVRTAGNVADAVALGSLEYAIEHLGVGMIVVLGHSGCGAVREAAAEREPGSPNLAALVSRVLPSVEENVVHSATDIADRSEIIRRALAGGTLCIVRAVYDLESGEVRRIP